MPGDPAEGLHLFERLPHADEAYAAAGGVEDGVGVAPAELLDQFVAHGFFAFDAEGLLEAGDVEPGLAGGGVGFLLGLHFFGDHAGAIGDEAVDHGDVGAVDDAFEVVGQGDVLRHEDVSGNSSGGRVGGERTGGVASAGDGKMLKTIVLRHGDGEAEAACFEGAGGVRTLFLDVEAGIAFAVEQGGPTFAEGDGGYVRQNAGIAPHAEAGRRGGGPGSDFVTFCGLFEGVQVVTDIEGAGAKRANGLGSVGRDVVVTARAFE